ncbi:MAG TPA: DUF4260 domain-containing protein [Pseudolabrys sp.]|jgi:hypothetical protein
MNAQANPSSQDQLHTANTTEGTPRLPATIVTTLRLEGLAVFAMAISAYTHAGHPWLVFAILFLSPDLSIAGYLMGPRIGATIYNLFHSYAGPAALWLAGLAFGDQSTAAIAIIWFAHIGFDRALGYGLKFTTSFKRTHLG